MRKVTIHHSGQTKRFQVPTEHDWNKVAEYLVGLLKPGDILALSGPLGAGKTTLVQHLARLYGVERRIASPTFALLRSYAVPGRGKIKRLLHLDAYRLETERELLALNLDEEFFDDHATLLVEWPENINKWLRRRSVINLVIES